VSEVETDRMRGCKREKERQDEEERKRRDEEEKKKERKSKLSRWYVCMYVCMYGIGMYWYGMGRYGTDVVWYGLFLFVLNRQIYDEVLRTLDASLL